MTGPAPDGQPQDSDPAAAPAPDGQPQDSDPAAAPAPDGQPQDSDPAAAPAPDGQPHDSDPAAAPAPDEQPPIDPTPASTPLPEAEPELPAEPEGPPGGGIFTLEGRRAPGLYLVAWILIVGGLAVTFVLGPMASDSGARAWLVLVGSFVVALGFAAAAGSQVLERAARDPERYRGPAPLLVFGAYYFALSVVGILLLVVIGIDEEAPFAFFGSAVIQTSAYVLAVWLLVVRTGALTWQDMRWPARGSLDLRELLRSAGAGLLVILPVTFVVLIVGTIVGLAFGVEAPRVYPLSETALDGLFVALGAAVIVPIGEELFFRGFALTAWKRDLGERSALHRSTIFFAVLHIANISGDSFAALFGQVVLVLAVIVPVGYVFGWLFLRFGMVGAISGHVSYNSLLLLLAYLASKAPEPGTSDWPL